MFKTKKETIISNFVVLGTAFQSDVKQLGGKAYYLDLLAKNNFNIATGFVLNTKIFDQFINANARIFELSQHLTNNIEPFSVANIRTAFSNSLFTENIKKEINLAINALGVGINKFIVRSSASVEDGKRNSFAGQFKTTKDVLKAELVNSVIEIYSSLYFPNAISYMRYKGVNLKDAKMAVIIQEFIDTDYAGVIFTVNPVTKDKNQILIESVMGLGENLVSGKTQPETIYLDKQEILIPTSNFYKASRCEQPNYIALVAKEALKIEALIGEYVDVEWGFKNGIVYIFQCRPITCCVE